MGSSSAGTLSLLDGSSLRSDVEDKRLVPTQASACLPGLLFKTGCQAQKAVESIWILFYSSCPVAVDATSASTGWAVLLHTRVDLGYEGEETSADSSMPILDDCERAAKQEDFRDGLSVLPLSVSPASAKHAHLPSTEESLDILQSVSPSDEM